jgi:hypothetical protein
MFSTARCLKPRRSLGVHSTRMELKELKGPGAQERMRSLSIKGPGARERMKLYDLTGTGIIYPPEFAEWVESAIARVTARSTGEELILPYQVYVHFHAHMHTP